MGQDVIISLYLGKVFKSAVKQLFDIYANIIWIINFKESSKKNEREFNFFIGINSIGATT